MGPGWISSQPGKTDTPVARGQRPHQLLRQVRRFTSRPPDQQAHHHGISLHGPGPHSFQLDMPRKTEYGRLGPFHPCFFLGL